MKKILRIEEANFKTKERSWRAYDGYLKLEITIISWRAYDGYLQFVAYNSHNGYYGHEAVLISKQLNYEEDL